MDSQCSCDFAIALLLQSTVSLATALVSAHLENNRSISHSNTVFKKSRKQRLYFNFLNDRDQF